MKTIYLLYSEKKYIYKIGMTENISQRISNLNSENKVADDWVLIDKVYVEGDRRELRRAERSILNLFFKHQSGIQNTKEYFYPSITTHFKKIGFSSWCIRYVRGCFRL